jgi:hypothetical protein
MSQTDTHEGGCACGHVRYQMASGPIIVHCCHCHHCQRQTGAAFAVNALIEADRVELLEGSITEITVPTPSGRGQRIARCPECQVALWSNYYMGGLDQHIRFIRVGTLDNPDQMPPDVHIYTEWKQSWVVLPPEDLAVLDFYDVETTYSQESLRRREALAASMGLKDT